MYAAKQQKKSVRTAIMVIITNVLGSILFFRILFFLKKVFKIIFHQNIDNTEAHMQLAVSIIACGKKP